MGPLAFIAHPLHFAGPKGDEMSESIDDGGPAFPLPAHSGANGEQSHPIYGMSLRDWFAGQALEKASKGNSKTAQDIAKRAYYIADAMLAERLAARKEKQ